jgi:hypothetical protein
VKNITLLTSGPALDFPRLEDTKNQLNIWKRTKGFEISFLPLSSARVASAGHDSSREHFDCDDLLMGAEGSEKSADVQPFPLRMMFEYRMVPVVPIYVDNESWFHCSVKAKMDVDPVTLRVTFR